MSAQISAWGDQIIGYTFVTLDDKSAVLSHDRQLYVYTLENAQEVLPLLKEGNNGNVKLTPVSIYYLMLYSKRVDIILDNVSYRLLQRAFKNPSSTNATMLPLIQVWQQSLVGDIAENDPNDVIIYFNRGPGEDFTGGIGKANLPGN